MKTYYLIFLCFLTLLISIVTIQSENKKELKTNFEIDNFYANLIINKGGQRRWAKHFPQWGDTKPRGDAYLYQGDFRPNLIHIGF
uniref:Glycine-rich protein n=1 Tax=Ononis spinosa TaxID=58890 RepID=A0A411AFJ2_ONOSP|nr:glycine-rich protein [Ononis spinosa]